MSSKAYVKKNFYAGLETAIQATASNDIPNLSQVEGLIAGAAQTFDAVRVETTANVDLATGGLLTIDGVTLVADDRVLVASQTTDTENGIYVAAAGAWTRAADMAAGSTAKAYASVFVMEGTTHGGHTMKIDSTTDVTVGTDSMGWVHAYTFDNDSAHHDYDDSGNTVVTGANVQAALDAAEAGFNTVAGHVDALTGVSADNLGAFDEDIIPDNVAIKPALQALETKAKANADAIANIDVSGQVETYYVSQKFTQTGTTLAAGTWTTVTHNLNETYPSCIEIYDAGKNRLTDSFDIELLDDNSLRIENEYPVALTDMIVVVRA